MAWLFYILVAQVLYASALLLDKYLLLQSVPPKVYAFYIGILGMLAFALVPFVGFAAPTASQFFLSVAAGFFLGYSLFRLYEGLRLFEASRFVPVVGAITSVCTLLIVSVLEKGDAKFSWPHFLSFALLVLGTAVIAFRPHKRVQANLIVFSLIVSVTGAIGLVLAREVYETYPFWSGLMLMRVGAFLLSVWFLLFSKEVHRELFQNAKGKAVQFWKTPRVSLVFLVTQGTGALAEILRNASISLVPFTFLPFVMALHGVQYALLFVFAIVVSLFSPRLLGEDLSLNMVRQKSLAIFFIISGLAILAFV